MPGAETALIHTAQVVRFERSNPPDGTRNPQGEYVQAPVTGAVDEGGVFDARLMYVSNQRSRAEPAAGSEVDTAREIIRRFEFLAADFDQEGDPVEITASDQIQFLDAGPLGTPTIEVTGQPELINDGEQTIVWWGWGVLVEDVANQ